MPLNKDQVLALLNAEAKRPKRGGPRGPRKGIDTTIRTHAVWFSLMQHLFNESTGEPAQCSNPDCVDKRPVQICADIEGTLMCRYCFLGGYDLKTRTEGQLPLTEGE